MIAGLAAAAELVSSWSEEEDEEEEEGSQLRRMRDRLVQNIEVLISLLVYYLQRRRSRTMFYQNFLSHVAHMLP